LNTDRSLAVIGVVIGLLGLVPIFRDAETQGRVLYSVSLSLLLLVFVVLYKSGRGPQYSTTMMRKSLKFQTSEATRATFTRDQTIRVNYGSMENVQVDGETPPAEDRQTLGCLLDVRKRFGATLYRGQVTTVCWTHDLVDSFPNRREFIDHDVTPATDLLELVVELPQGLRKFHDAALEERVAGEPARSLGSPTIEQNGLRLRATIKKPHPGRTIRMSWGW